MNFLIKCQLIFVKISRHCKIKGEGVSKIVYKRVIEKILGEGKWSAANTVGTMK